MTGAVVATDYFLGRPSGTDVQFVDRTMHHRWSADGQPIGSVPRASHSGHAPWALYGFPVLFCALVDLREEARFGPFGNAGWVNNRWGARLFMADQRAAYFPFFQGGGVFHLGLGFTGPNLVADQVFGNLLDTRVYGGKDRGHHHAGYLQLQRNHREHAAWLEHVAAQPPGVSAEMGAGGLVAPRDCGLPVNDERTVRPLGPADLDAVCGIDSDPETCRFFSWGPHGRDRTAEFVAQSVAEPYRWWALATRDGDFLGMGEIRPIADSPWPRACALTWVVAPQHRQKGHGAALVDGLVKAAYGQLDYETIVVRIDTENAASLATLAKRHDFLTDWRLDRTEEYSLRGTTRRRHVYVRPFPVACPARPDFRDLAACMAARERLLFEESGMWRP
mgnify:CR=1 FL=1